jgi:hypothetical protein
MVGWKAFAAVLALALLAGCASTDAPRSSASGPSTPPTAPSDPGDGDGGEPAADPPQPTPLRIAANGCTGFFATLAWAWDTGPGSAPPGWEQSLAPDGSAIGSDDDILALHCERVAWGPFERPLDLLFDDHSKATPPGGCTDSASRTRVLHGLWADAELAGYLASTYGMPVHAATFEVAHGALGEPSAATWTWSEAGEPESTLTVHSLDAGDFAAEFNERLAWDTGDGVSILALAGSVVMAGDQPVLSGPNQAIEGTLRPPMLHAERAGAYAGTGETLLSSDWTAEVLEFGDHRCERPLP